MGKLAINGGSKVREEQFFPWPDYDERELKYVEEVIRSRRWFAGMRGASSGTKTRLFEERFAAYHDAKFGIACANGSVALEIALRAAGVGAGDEVVVPGLTFIATLSAVLQVNAIPVLADIAFETQCLDPAEFEKAITPRTRAVIPVHFGGFACDMDRIRAIAARHGIAVIEDSAHAVGTVHRGGRKVGAIGDLGTFSFQESKNMTAGEGGIVLTDNPELAEKCIQYRSCGRHEGESWYVHYVLPTNFRLAELLSAVLLAQLEKVEEWTARKNGHAVWLGDRLQALGCLAPYPGDDCTAVNGRYLFLLHYDREKCGGVSRDRFVAALAAEGVPCHIGYPWPLNKNPMFEGIPSGAKGCPYTCPYYEGRVSIREQVLPVCERVCAETVVIPHQVLLSRREELEDIVRAVGKIQDYAAELL